MSNDILRELGIISGVVSSPPLSTTLEPILESTVCSISGSTSPTAISFSIIFGLTTLLLGFCLILLSRQFGSLFLVYLNDVFTYRYLGRKPIGFKFQYSSILHGEVLNQLTIEDNYDVELTEVVVVSTGLVSDHE